MRSLGKYQLIEQIGVGGFGEVYKGFDPYIKRHVAVKTCSSESENMRTRFFQEAEIAGNLHQKNITTVYDFGIDEGLPYLIQEYLSGEDLDRKVKRRDFLPYPEKLFYLLQIARGLAYAHSKGVIHRDIKPANIRILDDGTAKIMDFGIAKLAQQETGLTQTGMTLGTAAYLAPEQIRGERVATSTDIFSFGVLAYELLTFHRPFPGEQISAVLYALLHTEPQPVQDHWPAAPQDIIEVIDRCLSKQAAERYASGGELQRALELIQRQGALERSGAIASESPHAVATEAPTETPGLAPSEPTPTPTPRRLDELEITVLGPSVVPVPRSSLPPQAPQAQQPSLGSRPEAASRAAADLFHDPPAGGIDPTVHLTSLYGASAQMSKRSSIAPWIVVLALAVVAGLGGWWLGSRGGGDTGGSGGEGDAAQPTVEVEVEAGGGDGAGASDTQGAAATAAGGERMSGNGSGDGASAGPDQEQPSKEPIRGRLVVRAPSWTESMTLQVDGGMVRALVSNQEIPLAAGRHVLNFAIEEGAYNVQSRQVVELAEGQRQVVDPDIRQPAVLSIRPLPRTPQGQVRIDGGAPVQTPVAGLLLAPGPRRIVVEARAVGDDGTAASLSRTIDLSTGERVHITFDLDSGQINVTER